jgi:hypothetical protein
VLHHDGSGRRTVDATGPGLVDSSLSLAA